MERRGNRKGAMTDTRPEHPDPVAPGKVALIGFGEAATAFAAGWRQAGIIPDLRAFDIKTAQGDAATAAAKWQDYESAGLAGCATQGEALDGAEAVFSLVTADQAHVAARAAAAAMAPGTLYFDCNSCAPDTKRASAAVIDAAGQFYVDVAVMAPVHPKRHRTPLLISGPHVQAAAPVLAALGMQAGVVPGDVGRASAIKMMRSVMIKGLEALVLECVLSARKAGVDGEVLASLDATFPGFDWPGRAAYMMERATSHGIRRAAEMREVARTVTDLGLPGGMAAASVGWHQAMGDLGLAPGPDDYRRRADTILAALQTGSDA